MLAGMSNVTLAPLAWDDANGTVHGGGPACQETVFFFVVYGPCFGLVCLFGLVGNSLSFAVLHKYSKSSVATYLLKALAIMDNLFLASAAAVQIIPGMAIYFGHEKMLARVYTVLQKYAWPPVHMIQMGTVWMLVLVASNRYIAVCMPLRAPRLCTKRRVQCQMLALTATIVIYNVPRFMEYNYVKVNQTQPDNTTLLVPYNAGLANSKVYNILYENVSYCLFVFLLPLVILIFFNVHLVRELKKAQQYRRVLKTSGRTVEENNITLVMIIIIVVFIVCQTPASINQILFYVLDDDSHHATSGCTPYMHFFHLANLLITINSAVNFVVYCLFRRQFQQELRALLCRRHLKGGRPLRKTLLLRALHDRGSSLRSNPAGQESLPLHENSLPNDETGLPPSDNHTHNNHLSL